MYDIATFYCFRRIAAPEAVKSEIEEAAARAGVIGSILVASEGLNGTIAGESSRFGPFVAWLEERFELPSGSFKFSESTKRPFRKLTVRNKKEIVSLGVDGVDPNERVGSYVDPEEWDELIGRDDVLLIDCRNDYEIDVGSFEGAVDPGTKSFREFSAYADDLDPDAVGRVAMFCTGGIRCEKATSLLMQKGFEEVYHLRGGILRYLEERGTSSETWRGECFVFDRRVTVDRRLKPGSYDLCWACRMPVGEAAKSSDLYEAGVSCPSCYDSFTDEERAAKRERHRQFLARRASSNDQDDRDDRGDRDA